MISRVSMGLDWLDKHLGGGLIPGTMSLVIGATGVGKTQLAIHFAKESKESKGTNAIIFDLLARGDSQNHKDYAKSICNWDLADYRAINDNQLWDGQALGSYFKVFADMQKKVHRSQLSDNDWHTWQVKIQRQLHTIAQFFYAHFIRGVQKVVIDGIEPISAADDSAQHELFEYIYHKVIKQEDLWLAREVLREKFLAYMGEAEKSRYDEKRICTLFLQTSEENMLEDLIKRFSTIGGLEANANTIILMGRILQGTKVSRGLYIAKHRGSFASNEIIPFDIGDKGLKEAMA